MREWGWFFQQRIKLAKAIFRSRTGTKLLTRAMPENIPYMAVRCIDGTFLAPSTDAFTRRLITTGEWCHDETKYACDFLQATTGKSTGLVAIEIGGHIGTQTVQFANSGLFRRIITAEPLPEIHRLLRANLELNSVANIVTPIMLGVSDKSAELTMYSEALNSGKGSLVSDAEGMEFEIMKSCRDANVTGKVTIIEYSPSLYGPEKTAAFFEFLKSQFSTVRMLEKRCIRDSNWDEVAKVTRQADLVLT